MSRITEFLIYITIECLKLITINCSTYLSSLIDIWEYCTLLVFIKPLSRYLYSLFNTDAAIYYLNDADIQRYRYFKNKPTYTDTVLGMSLIARDMLIWLFLLTLQVAHIANVEMLMFIINID